MITTPPSLPSPLTPVESKPHDSHRCADHGLRLGLVLALAVAAWSRPAHALDDSDKEAIRSLSNQAAADFERRNYEAAREKFHRAYEIAKVPKLAVWEARANEKLGRLVAAYELYRQALGLEANDLWKGTIQLQAQKDAREELAQLQPRLPRLTISIEGAKPSDVAVKVDEVQVPSALLGVERYVDPGQRQIMGKCGNEVVTESVTVSEGKSKQLALRFRACTSTAPAAVPPPVAGQSNGSVPSKTNSEMSSVPSNPEPVRDAGTPRGSTQRTLGWVTAGVGAAGLVLGASTGVWLIAKHSDLKDKCPNDNDCHGQYNSDVDTFNKMRTVSVLAFAVGGVATAAGVTLLLTAPKERKATIALWMSPSSAGLTGIF
jgi:hypothetical protein